MAEFYLDKFNGGRIGLVHGGSIFSILYLIANILITNDNCFFSIIKTHYMKKIEINKFEKSIHIKLWKNIRNLNFKPYNYAKNYALSL